MSTPRTRLLVVDDDRAIREALAERFSARGYDVVHAGSGREALERLRRGVEVVLLDLQLPDKDGLWVLRSAREEELFATIIVVTAYGTVERAVEAMKLGAWDFLQKPFAPGLVEEAVRRAEERTSLARGARAAELARDEPELFAASEPMLELVETLRRAAASDATVLLSGESGTGKEMLARAVHRWSPRASGPLVALNCAAIPESLLESELFGHEKGAFTGAVARRIGRIEAAHGGTLFLDEVGEMSPALQAKLLRVLEQRSFERVGSTQAIDVDLRIVAATNRDLELEVKTGRFRQDLFYRLHVIAARVPPLRERRAEIAALARLFLARAAAAMGRRDLAFAPEALRALESHDWPGNVRELKNAIERAVALGEDAVIEVEDLPPEIVATASEDGGSGFHAQVEQLRKRVLEDALRASGGNQTQAAKALGLQRTYLARLIRKYGL